MRIMKLELILKRVTTCMVQTYACMVSYGQIDYPYCRIHSLFIRMFCASEELHMNVRLYHILDSFNFCVY